jgi:hypothetical protein
MFVEADADITVDDLGDVRCPPFPRSDDFLADGLLHLHFLVFDFKKKKYMHACL